MVLEAEKHVFLVEKSEGPDFVRFWLPQKFYSIDKRFVRRYSVESGNWFSWMRGKGNRVFNGRVIPDNQELEYIRKAAAGDHDAFRYLVLTYETPVLTYLHSILGDWENARDLAQETFIAAFYALPSWHPPETLNDQRSPSQKNGQPARSIIDHPLAPWLKRIATNHELTFLKRQGRHKHAGSSIQSTHYMDSQMNESTGKSPGSVEAWENRYVVRDLLHEALRQLSTDDATCIVLRFVAGDSYAEIADHLGITKEAVRKRVTRGLVVLRAIYQVLDRGKE